jgi:hypothetical protein
MTRLTCPSCRLRFASVSAATLTNCPSCAGELQAVASAEAALGFRLSEVGDPPAALPVAVAIALPTPADRPDKT